LVFSASASVAQRLILQGGHFQLQRLDFLRSVSQAFGLEGHVLGRRLFVGHLSPYPSIIRPSTRAV
jgi:hypothetical protein